MKTKALTLAILLAVTATLISQGLLTPPAGAPAPVMKTLTEVEPRTNLQATPPPPGVSTTSALYHYIITQPGSYYLSANLDVTRASGILINANNVTLDLNGFQIAAPATGADTGIRVADVNQQACIRNGSIRDFPDGLFARESHSCQISGLSFSSSTAIALSAGNAAIVNGCVLRNCSGNFGIYTAYGSTITGCTLWNCSVATGIAASQATVSNCAVNAASGTLGIQNIGGSTTGCTVGQSRCDYCFQLMGTVTGCTAVGNSHGTGVSGAFFLYPGSHISQCAAVGNTTDSTALGGDLAAGFVLSDNCDIDHCTAETNYGDGIRLASNCSALDNSCLRNGNNAHSGAGIFANGAANRIEGNNVANNTRGIELTGQRNIVVRNTARTNTSNYVIAAGNRIAQIVVPDVNAADIANANFGSADGFNNAGPWANFSF